MTQFAEVYDNAANECRRQLQKAGAMAIRVLSDGALRVVVSNNPMPNGWQYLASVSRNGKPVSAMEAMSVGSRFVPQGLKVANVDRQQCSMQVWFST